MLWHVIDYYSIVFWLLTIPFGLCTLGAIFFGTKLSEVFGPFLIWLALMGLFGRHHVDAAQVQQAQEVVQVQQPFQFFNERGQLVFFEFFVLWSLPFWILLVSETAFLFWVVSYRKGGFGLLSILAIALALQLFGNVPVFQWFWNNEPFQVFSVNIYPWSLPFIYLLVTSPWGFVKWLLFVRDNSFRYDEIFSQFLEEVHPDWPKDGNQFTPAQKVAWKKYFEDHSCQSDNYEYTKVEFDPTWRNHKQDIMTWMMFWPWSMLWTILNDPIRKIIKHVFYYMTGWLQSISNWYWKDKRGHMPTAEEIRQVAEEERQQRNNIGGYVTRNNP